MLISIQRQPALETLAVLSSAKSLAGLDGFCRSIWIDWGAGRITDDQAQALAETIEARRREIRGVDRLAVRAPQVTAQAVAAGRPSHFPPKRRPPRSPDRKASIERRRMLAASGPMPPTLACRFTTGQLSVLRIVADAVRDHGACRITIGEIAARAGVCQRLAQDALRLAAADGLVMIEERRRDRRPNLPNVVQIVSREWLAWIERGRTKGGGCKKVRSTDKGSFRTSYGDRVSHGQLHVNITNKRSNRDRRPRRPPAKQLSGDRH